jgi:hypothetical protein
MIEYLRCIYMSWATDKTTEYCVANYDEYVALASRLMHYTPDEIRLATEQQLWIKSL